MFNDSELPSLSDVGHTEYILTMSTVTVENKSVDFENTMIGALLIKCRICRPPRQTNRCVYEAVSRRSLASIPSSATFDGCFID